MQIEFFSNFTEKQREYLQKLQLFTLQDILSYFPRAYLDLTKQSQLKNSYHNDFIFIAAKLMQPAEIFQKGRQKFIRANFIVEHEDDGLQEKFACIWFNAPYLLHKLKNTGEVFLLYGRLQKNKYGQYSFINPTFESKEENKYLKGLVPIYTLKSTIKQGNVRALVQKALSLAKISSYIPLALQKKYKLSSLVESYHAIHAPQNIKEKILASERIAVEEYFILLSAFRLFKGKQKKQQVLQYSCTKDALNNFIKGFPFTFTNAQLQAVNDIYNDLIQHGSMNRLLQGDVGSGKTAVALCGIFIAVKSGYQAAMIAPTEVLAKQNFMLLKRYFPQYSVEYLAGSCSAKAKSEIKKRLQSGEIAILCGTHALLQEDVHFHNFAFCVCDEQHRFGVAQRNILSEKGSLTSMLIMSATPIPRTLSLILYGDLDCTTMLEKPKERIEISTSIVPETKYTSMLKYLAEKAKEGEQCYYICPKIEEDEEGTIMSVQQLYEELKVQLPSVKFVLLHGKMKEKEKLEVMQNFKEGQFDALVSTTVVEVGVDVPNATHMVIYNAERFGLSQLHQLRGRVGRGNKKSYCFLLCGRTNEEALERLQILKKNSDGFKIAEADLAMRGGGDFLGTKQSGKFFTELKNLNYSTDVIFLAKKIVDESADYPLDENLKNYLEQKFESLKEIILN